MDCFALLDDCEANAVQQRSRLYTGLVRELSCLSAAGFDALIAQMQEYLAQGLYAVAVMPYELGPALAGLACAGSTMPCRVLIFSDCRRLDRAGVDQWLQTQTQPDAIAGVADMADSVDQCQFSDAIAQIRALIASGDTYQVNYTYRIHFKSYGEPLALYGRLRQRQAVPYGALIVLPDQSAVLSLSPELFLRHHKGELSARPMKGTAAACTAGNEQENRAANATLSAQLASDAKNRAENVMIVDLLRNDLSRVARPGTVRVPQLFEVSQFNAVLQMSSGVTAELREQVSLAQLLRAVYPCGSITGAPKHRTMQIIAALETGPRGVYTGAIGWFDPPGLQGAAASAALPDFCLSVPIRTLHLQAPGALGLRAGVLGVGAGIVFDSVAGEEYEECRLKARFLTGLPAQFALFETMFATRTQGCRHVQLHLDRIGTSARFFGIDWSHDQVLQLLQRHCASLPDELPRRLKLTLHPDGRTVVQDAPLQVLDEPVGLLLSEVVQQSEDLWLRHKSTLRQQYDQAWQDAERQGAFDMLFFNQHGALTEGGRSNVLVQIDGQWCTPPLEAGLLPGVMRTVLLQDPKWNIAERNISRAELLQAERIAVCNALRGVLPAYLR